jgi:hypothetical protein
MRKLYLIAAIAITDILLFLGSQTNAQSKISFQCKELNINKTSPLKCDAISEDDPGDLAECYSYLITYFAGGTTDQRFELRFPAKVASYHWTQSNEADKNDSLSAYLVYDTNPKVYGYTLQAYPKDFTIKVTRYDATKGGVIEGTFNGTMQAYLAWRQQTVSLPVKGNFHATRTGKFGDECRKQRQSEKAVINKAVKIFGEVFPGPLQNMDWKITEENKGYTTQIANHPVPFRPIFMCSDFFDLKLSTDPTSDYGKSLQDSMQFYNQQVVQNSNNNNHTALVKASQNLFRLQTMQTAEISIDGNYPYIRSEELTGAGSKDRYEILHIKGVAYAFQLYRAPVDELGTPEEKTMLFFGNWTGADMHSGTYAGYPFIHKNQSPFIENFVVTITAPASVANGMIKNIDWNKLNEALSK